MSGDLDNGRVFHQPPDFDRRLLDRLAVWNEQLLNNLF